jgi:hypothetical protein
MEEKTVKHLKSPAARGALALVAGSAALTLTACGAGQISQTANQAPAVNGTNGTQGDAVVRDVSLIIQQDNSVSLKFNASNQGIEDEDITLDGVKVQDATLDFGGQKTIAADCNIVADSAASLKEMGAQHNEKGCTEYLPTRVTGENFYPGAARNVTFTFNTGDITVNAPVTSFYPEAGQTDRGQDGITKDGTADADIPVGEH